MKTNLKQSQLSDFFTLLVFFFFALSLLFVILSGARIYKNTVAAGNNRYTTRTAARYMTTRIRQADSWDRLSIDRFGNSDALYIRETFEEEQYITILYCHDGWLKELFCAENNDLSPGDGEKILPLQELDLALEQNCVLVTLLLPEGRLLSFPVYLRNSREVPT